MPVIECDPAAARERLASAGVEIEPGNTAHEQWRARTDEATAVAYEDKVVVQGSRPWSLAGHLEDRGGRAYVYFDGASRGNPGPAAAGWVIVTDEGIVAESGERIGRATNNEAEYEAIIRALAAARDLGFDRVDVRGDSELIIRQLTGVYQVSAPNLREKRATARELLESFESWDLQHVPREVNDRADDLADEALDDR